MDPRLVKFRSYADHAWLHRVYSKLTQNERALAESFIQDNAALDRDQFFLKVNRMFLHNPNKPKHAGHILELLSCCNS